MGLGKTLSTIATLRCIKEVGKMHGLVLVVAPLTTIGHWMREFEAWSDLVSTEALHSGIRDLSCRAGRSRSAWQGMSVGACVAESSVGTSLYIQWYRQTARAFSKLGKPEPLPDLLSLRGKREVGCMMYNERCAQAAATYAAYFIHGAHHICSLSFICALCCNFISTCQTLKFDLA